MVVAIEWTTATVSKHTSNPAPWEVLRGHPTFTFISHTRPFPVKSTLYIVIGVCTGVDVLIGKGPPLHLPPLEELPRHQPHLHRTVVVPHCSAPPATPALHSHCAARFHVPGTGAYGPALKTLATVYILAVSHMDVVFP